MTVRRVSRFWSKEEDEKLRRAVRQAGKKPILSYLDLLKPLGL